MVFCLHSTANTTAHRNIKKTIAKAKAKAMVEHRRKKSGSIAFWLLQLNGFNQQSNCNTYYLMLLFKIVRNTNSLHKKCLSLLFCIYVRGMWCACLWNGPQALFHQYEKFICPEQK